MDNYLKKEEVPVPQKEEKEKFLDLETEILYQIGKAVKGHRPMEAYFLGWSTIEQFMLPRLIRFIARRLKTLVPKDTLETNYIHVIKYYYFLSHDYELFLALNEGRKNRNRLTHELYQMNDWTSIKKNYKKYLKKDIGKIFQLFQDRFNGKTPIPVLSLYTSGWNDGLNKAVDIIQNKEFNH